MMMLTAVTIPALLIALLISSRDEITIDSSRHLPEPARVSAMLPKNVKVINKQPLVYGAFKKALSESLTARGYDVGSSFRDAQQVIKIDVSPITSDIIREKYKSPIYGVTSIRNEIGSVYDDKIHQRVKVEKSVPVYGVTGYEDKYTSYTVYNGEVELSFYSHNDKGEEKLLGETSVNLYSGWKITPKVMACLAQYVEPYLYEGRYKKVTLSAFRWQIKMKCK